MTKEQYQQKLHLLESSSPRKLTNEELEYYADIYCKVKNFKTFEEYINYHVIGEEWWKS